MMKKTEIEIAADAIKYCKTELLKLKRLILQAELGETKRPISEGMLEQWRYEAAKLEFILGESEEIPIPFWRR